MGRWNEDEDTELDEPDEAETGEDAQEDDNEDAYSDLGSAVAGHMSEMADTWLAHASTYRLLTAAEEIRIGQGQCVCTCCGRDPHDALVNHNLRLVVSVAKRYRLGATRAVGREDIWQAGALGLMTAAQRWDWQRGMKFSTYATWWIRQSISRWLADCGWTVREPAYRHARRTKALKAGEEYEPMLLPASLDVHATRNDPESDYLIDILPDAQAPDPLAAVIAADERARLFALMRRVLKPREAVVLALRYGLSEEAAGEGMTLEAAGRILGITRERVRQVEAMALDKLRAASSANETLLRKPAGVLHYEQSPSPAAVAVVSPVEPAESPAPVVDVAAVESDVAAYRREKARRERRDWRAAHRDEVNERRNARRRELRAQRKAEAAQAAVETQPPAKVTKSEKPTQSRTRRRLAPDVSSPATGRETREPHVSQSSQQSVATNKQTRRRAPSRSAASAEVVMTLLPTTNEPSAVGVTGPDMSVCVSGGKRNTPHASNARGSKKQAKNRRSA